MEFNELVESFAASLGVEGVEIDGGAAAFEIDGMKVDVFHDEAVNTVMVYGEIGQPPSGDDRSFGPAMLKANHLFGGTGGATLCQDPETGAYGVFQAFDLEKIDLEAFSANVARIADKTEYWRKVLDAFQTAERERGQSAAEEVLVDAIHGGSSYFIQV